MNKLALILGAVAILASASYFVTKYVLTDNSQKADLNSVLAQGLDSCTKRDGSTLTVDYTSSDCKYIMSNAIVECRNNPSMGVCSDQRLVSFSQALEGQKNATIVSNP